MMDMIGIALLATWPVLSSAQEWSPQQQEIIDQIRRCNDSWVDSLARKKFEIYDSVCPATEQAVFWYTGGDVPVQYRGQNGLWASSSSTIRSVSWRDLRPVRVQVDGDVAFIYYSVTWIPEPQTGPTIERPSKRLTIFQRRNGRWVMAGGSIAPAR